MQSTQMMDAAAAQKDCSVDASGRFRQAGRARRLAIMAFGAFNVMLGLVGAVLPLMPSTVFLLIAAWCFTQSSPRFADWLYGHEQFGPALRRWRDARVIPLRAKLLATASISTSLIVLHGVAPQIGGVKWAVTAICLAVLAFLLSRPHQWPADTPVAATATVE